MMIWLDYNHTWRGNECSIMMILNLKLIELFNLDSYEFSQIPQNNGNVIQSPKLSDWLSDSKAAQKNVDK